jgi:hypothetical protein
VYIKLKRKDEEMRNLKLSFEWVKTPKGYEQLQATGTEGGGYNVVYVMGNRDEDKVEPDKEVDVWVIKTLHHNKEKRFKVYLVGLQKKKVFVSKHKKVPEEGLNLRFEWCENHKTGEAQLQATHPDYPGTTFVPTFETAKFVSEKLDYECGYKQTIHETGKYRIMCVEVLGVSREILNEKSSSNIPEEAPEEVEAKA